MAPKVKLLYFDGRGRGEITRMILNYGGIAFEDKRVKMEEWPEVKPSKLPQRDFSEIAANTSFSNEMRIHAGVDVG